jgi:hypothetical protein
VTHLLRFGIVYSIDYNQIESHFVMTLTDAQQNANQILDAERTASTTNMETPTVLPRADALGV